MLLITLIIIALILIIILFTFFVFPWFIGAPYDITRKNSLKNIIKLTSPKPEDKIAELGSGDGRVCIALAKSNLKSTIHGFEINPFLVLISRRKIKSLNLQNQIKIYWKNFWKVNLSKYNKIVFFQFSTITKKLEKKFNNELKKGTKIISHNWTLPNYKIKKQLGKQHLSYGVVYLYEK
jgi:cyclopropane fatty-acyl-phospholipid synthase-like methyltransferase